MNPKRTVGILFLLILLIALFSPSIVLAGSDLSQIPTGFYLVVATTGVNLYRKDYPNGNPDFVQLIDLSSGASIELLHGDIVDIRDGEGAYGGRDPKMLSKKIQDYWEDLSINYPNAFCVTNGQFFLIKEYPTRLPFPLKVNGEIISDGYALNEFSGQKLILELWKDKMDLQPLSKESLYSSSAPDIIGGLSEDARKSPNKSVGRTFVGVMDGDQDGNFEMLLVYNTQSATQEVAAAALKDFGAVKVMMLDGGGSTQLICRHQPLISSDRIIPQAIGILAGIALSPQTDMTISDSVSISNNVELTKTSIIDMNNNQLPQETKEVQPKKTRQHPILESVPATEATTPNQTQIVSQTPVQPSPGASIQFMDVLWIPIALILLAPFILFLIAKPRKQ